MQKLFTPCYFAAIVFSSLQKCISVLRLHLISICTLLPLDQVKFLRIFGICGCSQPTSHCRALKTSPASFQPRFILFLNSGNAEQGDGLIKNQRIGSIFLWNRTDISCLGNLNSLHKWFSFAMRMKVWPWKSSPKTPSDLSPTRLKDEFENRATAVEAFHCIYTSVHKTKSRRKSFCFKRS